MCQIDYRPKAFQAVAVALANNEIHLYKDKFLVDVIQVEENIYSMKFGRLGREDATLVMITKSNLISIFNKQKKTEICFSDYSWWVNYQNS
jgi:Bardet-Biedl syndrome 1 protein